MGNWAQVAGPPNTPPAGAAPFRQSRLKDVRLRAMLPGKSDEALSLQELSVWDWKMRDHALFIGYAPAHDPKYAIVSIIEHGAVPAKPGDAIFATDTLRPAGDGTVGVTLTDDTRVHERFLAMVREEGHVRA